MAAQYGTRGEIGRTFWQVTLGGVLAGVLVACGNTTADDTDNASTNDAEAIDQADEAGQQDTTADEGQDAMSRLQHDYDFTAEAQRALGAEPKRQVSFEYSDEFAQAYLDEGEAFSFGNFVIVAGGVGDDGLCRYQIWPEPSDELTERVETFQQQRLDSARAGEPLDSQEYLENYSDESSQAFLKRAYNVEHEVGKVKCTTGAMPEDDQIFTVRPVETFDLENGSRSEGGKFMFGATSGGTLVFADYDLNGLTLDSYGNWVAE
jgi:hypothetical protein